ncbi:MAG: hypothetical protein JSU68_11215 [Phycisphaerales bacterium]|nr:MAG: hypothetical protein JSU68_11215 [Phycisphaerales bacterium]
MPISVRNLRLNLGENPELLPERAARRLRVPAGEIGLYAIVRRSIDARRRGEVFYSYNLQVTLRDRAAERRVVARLHRRDVELLRAPERQELRPGTEPMPERPIIVGFGPAGMFAGLLLAEHGYRPIILERGRDVSKRHRDILRDFYRQGRFHPESNLLYGEGGAGTYSDGKLYTRVHDSRVDLVMRTLFRFGIDPNLLIDARPHAGSDRLPGICRRVRLQIESLGGQVQFERRLSGLRIEDGRLKALTVGPERLAAPVCILATGHSARDTYAMLAAAGVKLVSKPYQMGLRIEHPQGMVNRWQYGEAAACDTLPAAEYQVVAKGVVPDGSNVFSFCMCPGGEVLVTNEVPGLLATNGASRSQRQGPLASSGLVLTLEGSEHGDDPLAAIAFQRSWEEQAFELTGRTYRLPCQRAADFLAGRLSDGEMRTSCPLGADWADIRRIVPHYVHEAIARALIVLEERMPGYAGQDAILTGPETRGSAPIRVLRDRVSRESVTVRGLYPVGEGAGYAGGIVSSAVDGLKTAEVLMARYAPPS